MNPSTSWRLTPLALAAALPLGVLAQTAAAPAPLQTIVITGNPLRSETLSAPVSVLAGDELVQRRSGSLGETLDGLPGVAATRFGPTASRPVIRGLDGERVRVMNNSNASLDASALSFDHAVPTDPLIATRIEVLRGPAALLYGGSAIGGVVNVLDNRVPQRRIAGFGGAADLRLGGAASERSAAALIEGGGASMAWHADLHLRDAGLQRAPSFAPVADGETLPVTQRVRNSDSRAQGGAVGASWFFGEGRIGLAFDRHRSEYGVVAEPDVSIDMHRNQVRLEGEWTPGTGWLSALRLHGQVADYEHREIEGSGEIGTTFKNRGGELRLEAAHRPLAGLKGVLGVQVERGRFSALGEEAFVPSTQTRREGVFVLEEFVAGPSTTSAGLRLERTQVDSRGDADPAEPKFGAAAGRRFSLASLSLAQRYALGHGWAVSGQASRNQRAPSAAELFANGVHAATGTFERGDPGLGAERGQALELALERQAADGRLRIAAWSARFARYIALRDTGEQVDEAGDVVPPDTPDSVPLYRFEPVRARLQGLEAEWRQRHAMAGWVLHSQWRYDLVRATDRDRGEPLPRIAPWRLGLSLGVERGGLTARIDVNHNGRQSRVPAVDSSTPASTLVDVSLSWRTRLGGSDALWFAKLGNLGNERAYNATTNENVRRLSPLPARALSAGLRVGF